MTQTNLKQIKIMKTPEYYLDEVAKENGFVDYGYMAVSLTDDGLTDRLIKYTSEAILRHSKEACEEQRINCAEESELDILCQHGYGITDKQSILNAKSPIE